MVRAGSLDDYEDLRLIATGTAGSGKSRLSRAIVRHLRERAHALRRRNARDVCLLAAPTGCASFQMKNGACTLHRAFRIAVGAFKRLVVRTGDASRAVQQRLVAAYAVILDEMSMIGRAMLGKIDHRCREARGDHRVVGVRRTGSLGGLGCIELGDFKQAPPIGDESQYREEAYRGKGGQRQEDIDDNVIPTNKLVARGLALRNEFQDVVFLGKVHRRDDGNDEMSPGERQVYREEADRFQEVMLRMADCEWTPEDHAWLFQRCRAPLSATPEGKEELKKFRDAPLQMDSKQVLSTGEEGADAYNAQELRRLAARTGVPIARIRATHKAPKSLSAERLPRDEFRGMSAVLELCVGARVLLTRNRWVEAGLMNGALGYVRGFIWPQGGNPAEERIELAVPLYVVVEFDEVVMGEEGGRPRTFFPWGSGQGSVGAYSAGGGPLRDARAHGRP